MDYASIIVSVQDHVARITLNRPESANAVNLELGRELMHAANQLSEDRTVRAVVLTGAGRFFCAGGDLRSFAAEGERLAPHLKEVTTYLHAAVSRFARMDAPTIAAVNGAAAGAGMSLACSCDFILAGESARFTMAYTRAGLTPDGSSTYFLPRIVGLKRALDLALTNRTLTAPEAEAWGIVSRVVPDDGLLAAADSLARELATGPTGAFGATKRLFYEGWGESLETQMEHETQAIAGAAKTVDGQEGIAAFLAKRPPEFRGT